MAKNPVSVKNPFKEMYKGTTHNLAKDKMHRPEGAGNFDNMDDRNIVNSINTKQGTIEDAPTENKDLVNKEYVDNSVVTTLDHGALTGLSDDDHTQYVLRQPTSNTIINEDGGDFDFRIESNNNENAFFINAGNGRVGIGTGNPATPFHMSTTNPIVDTVTNLSTFTHNTSGTPENGIGVGYEFEAQTSTTIDTVLGQMRMLWTDVTHATRTSDFILTLTNSGSLAERFRVFGDGTFKSSGYGEGVMHSSSTGVMTSSVVDISTDTNLVAGTGLTLTEDTLITNDTEINHNNLTNYIANQHIDWTSATNDFNTSGEVSLGGELNLETDTITADTTAGDHNIILCNNTEDITVTLPAASNTDRTYYIKKINSGTDIITIDANGTETIDGALTVVLYVQYDAIRIVSDGSNWHTISDEIKRHSVICRRDAAQTLATSSTVTVALDATEKDIGVLADLSNDQIVIRRDGLYLINVNSYHTGVIDDGKRFWAGVTINTGGGNVTQRWGGNMCATTNGAIVADGNVLLDLDAGDIIKMLLFQDNGGNISTVTSIDGRPKISVIEIR